MVTTPDAPSARRDTLNLPFGCIQELGYGETSVSLETLPPSWARTALRSIPAAQQLGSMPSNPAKDRIRSRVLSRRKEPERGVVDHQHYARSNCRLSEVTEARKRRSVRRSLPRRRGWVTWGVGHVPWLVLTRGLFLPVSTFRAPPIPPTVIVIVGSRCVVRDA